MNLRIFFKIYILLLSVFKTVHLQNAAQNGAKTESSRSCEEGWIQFEQNCYKAIAEPLTWSEASAECASKSGHLASIHSKEEQDFISTSILLSLKRFLWIGLHDTTDENNFVWEDGTNVDFTNWSPGEPSGVEPTGRKEDCVQMNYNHHAYANGEWNDEYCDIRVTSVCKKKALRSSELLFCSLEKGGGLKFQGACYNHVNQKKSWDDAEQYCRDTFKGHLVTISDFVTDWFLNYLLKDISGSVWIGIKLRDQLQQKWSSGWLVSYDFLPNEVQSHSKEEVCVLRSGLKTWEEVACSKEYSFICESSKGNPIKLKNPLKGWKCPETPKVWRDLDGEFCYYFDTTSKVTWFQAHNECVKRGGSLTSILSKEESDILYSFVEGTQLELFIGLTSLLSGDGTYTWTDGTPINYTYWSGKEPTGGNEKCVEIYTDSMRWNDAKCEDTRGFICSTRKVPSTKNQDDVQDGGSANIMTADEFLASSYCWCFPL